MLIVKNLDKSFDGNTIFKNLSFYVQDGEKVAVVGLNGAGKSTLLKLLYNILSPDSGVIRIGKKTDLGYYAQEYERLDSNITILKNVLDTVDCNFLMKPLFADTWR